MILKFSVENYKSFDEEATLSAIASPAAAKTSHANEVQGVPVLNNLVIFGPNSSGKSNLVSALAFLQRILRRGLGQGSPRERQSYCRLRKENKDKDTIFHIWFSQKDVLFSYDITMRIAEARILTERLSIKERAEGDFEEIFHRTRTGDVHLSPYFDSLMDEDERRKLLVYKEDYKKNLHVPFLSFLCSERNYDGRPTLKKIAGAYDGLVKNVVVIRPEDSTPVPINKFQEKSFEEIQEMLDCFDLGISNIELQVVSRSEILDHMPEKFLSRCEKYLLSKADKFNFGHAVGLACSSPSQFVFLELTQENSILYKLIKLSHKQSDSLFDYEEESDGTRRIFQLMDMMLSTETGMVYIVDELDRSLHTSVVAAFVHMFNMGASKWKKQLIFTTHDIHLLDVGGLFAHDEIYFMDRGQSYSSHLVSLLDFPAEKEQSIAKAYLQGRFGALPHTMF